MTDETPTPEPAPPTPNEPAPEPAPPVVEPANETPAPDEGPGNAPAPKVVIDHIAILTEVRDALASLHDRLTRVETAMKERGGFNL